MRLLLHDTLATSPFVHPLTAGWISPDIAIEARSELGAADVGPEDVALVPAPEIAALLGTHTLGLEAAVVSGSVGSIAMRVPVRPDEVERTPVRLWRASGAAEVVARATLKPFYGIVPMDWTRDDTSEAQVVVVEGAEALRPPEAGFAEDLCRAWFVLTGQPAITHVLAVPRTLDRTTLGPALETLVALRDIGHERRRDLRRDLADGQGLDRDRLTAFFAEQRLALEPADQRALLLLLQRGTWGSAYPPIRDPASLTRVTEPLPSDDPTA